MNQRWRNLLATAAALALAACPATTELEGDAGVDAGGPGRDSGAPTDAGSFDAGVTFDAGSFDAGVTFDAGSFDAGSFDAGLTFDAGSFDAGVTFDAGSFDAGSFDAGVDAGVTDGGRRFVYIVTEVAAWVAPAIGVRDNPAWRNAAQPYFASTDASFGFTYGNGFTWDTIGPPNSGNTQWTADSGLAYLSMIQDQLNASTLRQTIIALDLEGAAIPAASYSGRHQPMYAQNLAALESVLTRFTARYGLSADGGKPLSFYDALTGNTYYFSEADMRAYRSATYPDGGWFDGGEFSNAWQWASAPLAFSGFFATQGGSPSQVAYAPYSPSDGAYSQALGNFVHEFAQDWMYAAYTAPEFQPSLRAMDVMSPSLYLVGGYPDVSSRAKTTRDAGSMAGLGGESPMHYEWSKATAQWLSAQTDRPRDYIPYVASILFWNTNAGPNDSRPSGSIEFWDERSDAGVLLWQSLHDDQWLGAGNGGSNTYVTSGQLRATFGDFVNSIEAMKRGAEAGGHPLDGLFLWDPYAWSFGNARQYVINGRTQTSLAPFLDGLWRIVMTEWSISLPQDSQYLGPIFGGTYDRDVVWGALAAKPLSAWTIADVDDAIAKVWKVRCQAYLEAARQVIGR